MRHPTWMRLGGLLGLATSLALVACGSDDSSSSGTSAASGGATGSGGGGASGGSGGDGGGVGGAGGGAEVVQESEPNDGESETDYDDLSLGQIMEGAIGTPGDTDVFRLPTTGATGYEATLEPSGELSPHLTVIDDGRGGDPAGQDYVKIVRAASGEARIQWLAMGTGGYFLVVRDARNVDGQSVGGAAFTYQLSSKELAASEVTVGDLPLASSHTGELSFGGAIDLFTFTAAAGQDALIDMQASGDLDGRLFIVAAATSDWIARNDDRAVDDPNPLIDAPLTEGGELTLVVESIAEEPTGHGYSLSTSVQ